MAVILSIKTRIDMSIVVDADSSDEVDEEDHSHSDYSEWDYDYSEERGRYERELLAQQEQASLPRRRRTSFFQSFRGAAPKLGISNNEPTTEDGNNGAISNAKPVLDGRRQRSRVFRWSTARLDSDILGGDLVNAGEAEEP